MAVNRIQGNIHHHDDDKDTGLITLSDISIHSNLSSLHKT